MATRFTSGPGPNRLLSGVLRTQCDDEAQPSLRRPRSMSRS